ncbi:squalene/phytoene synthase family protein [Brachybacterium sp. JHP9]|uniref:Squalene/phytoene synthase family protein n=1 Tax=Brachybacterium equifaecis TaxID=2910770 RepID=A0ABT0QXX3_9MICO|nr:squalene/phytoene synthase family protein [Brachybacterium equifaecis]MCL6422511.1 squalene/phytoene synthase family protein [Brachybacterium equifaecis]
MASPLDHRNARDYDLAASAASSVVISRYSTSFALSTRLLRGVVRPRVRSIYALVRVADEVVDGAARGHGLTDEQTRAALVDLERRTELAMGTGFSSDLVVHAFARAARATGITPEMTRPFFASMRTDLELSTHDEASFAEYVDGSAEAVGLMCLQVFATDAAPHPVAPDPSLVHGARRLGAAFQKVNFLRDLQADADSRGRAYFPEIDPHALTERQKHSLLDDIDADLAVSRAAIGRLPASSRTAVLLAHDLFAELARGLRAAPAETLRTSRIRVADHRKAALLARALTPLRGRG